MTLRGLKIPASIWIFPFICALSFTSHIESYRLTWEDHFSAEEKDKIKTWLDRVEDGRAACFGEYAFQPVYILHSRRNAAEPVPWAHTTRSSEQGVHFYVDPAFTLDEFIADWTGPHEISHLALPFVGKEYMWFSEGFASFMQYQVMHEMGILSEEDVRKKYSAKSKMAGSAFRGSDKFRGRCDELLKSHNYPAIYWGGAYYFMLVDQALKKEKNISLVEVIKAYQTAGRMEDESIHEVIRSLDKVSRSRIFSGQYQRFTEKACSEIFISVGPDE